MDTTLLEEALCDKTSSYMEHGLKRADALRRARDEFMARAREAVSGADLFCLRLLIRGAAMRIAEQPDSRSDPTGRPDFRS